MFHFHSNHLDHPLLFGFFSRHLSSNPNIRYTFIYHLVRYSLSLIYKGIRLYARVTNLGPEGKQTLHCTYEPMMVLAPIYTIFIFEVIAVILGVPKPRHLSERYIHCHSATCFMSANGRLPNFPTFSVRITTRYSTYGAFMVTPRLCLSDGHLFVAQRFCQVHAAPDHPF